MDLSTAIISTDKTQMAQAREQRRTSNASSRKKRIQTIPVLEDS